MNKTEIIYYTKCGTKVHEVKSSVSTYISIDPNAPKWALAVVNEDNPHDYFKIRDIKTYSSPKVTI